MAEPLLALRAESQHFQISLPQTISLAAVTPWAAHLSPAWMVLVPRPLWEKPAANYFYIEEASYIGKTQISRQYDDLCRYAEVNLF